LSGEIKVFLADKHAILREGIRALLEPVPDIEVIGEAADGNEAVRGISELRPDVAVMGITLPHLSGLDATQQIKQATPDVNVLILTVQESGQYLVRALAAGASGYLVKTTTMAELVRAIRVVHQGDVYLYPSVARVLVKDYLSRVNDDADVPRYEGLTERERQVLGCIAEDMKNREIASFLGISVRTVQSHRTNLMDKLGAHDRTELVKYAIRRGMIEL
jgi:two-component system response regulator NreC